MTRLSIVLSSALLVSLTVSASAQTASAPKTSQTSTQAPPKPANTAPAPAPAPAPAKPAPAIPFAADSKVGFVNMQSVYASSDMGKKAASALSSFRDRKGSDYNA